MTFSLPFLPKDLSELKTLPGADLQNEYAVAALCVAALCQWENNRDAAVEMINYLRGPRPLSVFDQQFLRDRLGGKQYKTFSFFQGASVQNNYTPSMPLTIEVSSNPYSYNQENMATLYLKSAGADSVRPISLRRKPSTGQWFVWEITFLSDIRVPVSDDPWA